MAVLREANVLNGDPAGQQLLAANLAELGCTSFDIEDLAKAARKQSSGNPAGLLTHWLRAGDWKNKLGASRGAAAAIYGEPERENPTSTTAGNALDPARFGMAYCSDCGSMALGKHWVHHGPVDWRPGDPIPATAPPPSPPDPKPRPKAIPPDKTHEQKLAELKAYAARNNGSETA